MGITFEQVYGAVFTGCLRAGIAKCRAFLESFDAPEGDCAVIGAAEVIAGGIECGAVPLAFDDDVALVAQRWVSGFLLAGEHVPAPSANKLTRDSAVYLGRHHLSILWRSMRGYSRPSAVLDAAHEYESTRDDNRYLAPLFTNTEMEPGMEPWTLGSMIAANPSDYGQDDELHAWLRSAQVGDEYRDIVTVERVR